MKKSHIFLFIIFMFIISCGNKVTAPSVSDITYYDPNEAIIKTYPYNLYDGITATFVGTEGAFKKIAESANAIIYVEESQIDKGITKESFFSETGISASNFKGKGAQSELGGDKLAKILTIYRDINPDWLITGRGSMLREETIPLMETKEPEPAASADLVRIPIVDISVAAGSGYNNMDYIEEVDSIIMPSTMVKDGKKYLCVRVKGQSMIPSIQGFTTPSLKPVSSSWFFLISRDQGRMVQPRRSVTT